MLAALLWDSSAGGFSVSEPGSALALVWRAAQEMAGLQEAAAIAHPGTLMASLMPCPGSGCKITGALAGTGGSAKVQN